MADTAADDEREEELSSIAAIFPELAVDPENPFAASLDITVAPSAPLAITFPPAIDGAPPPASLPTPPTSENEGNMPTEDADAHQIPREIHRLSYLPPLRLQVTLPDGYPAEKPPSFSLSTTPQWLPDTAIQKLKNDGVEMWEEYGHMQVVFAYIDMLQQGAERCFDLVGAEGAVLEVPASMKIALLDYDIKAKREQFEAETFDCGVCLEPKKGSACHRLGRCGHVFCVACLQDFYNNCIQEGDVASVRCLDPGCGKEKEGRRKRKSERTLNPSELLQIPLEQATVRRYVELKRKKKLESDKSTVYCPRKWCQGPARSKKYPKITDLTQITDSDSESDDDDPNSPTNNKAEEPVLRSSDNRLAVCEDCEYAFCRVCQGGWHGDYIRCYPRSAAELSEEEQASYEYLRLHTSPCPECASPTQKTHGCNHMACFQCRTHFCYLCGAWLDPGNPYQHFNRRETPCYQRLWELEEGDEGAPPEGGAGAGAGAGAGGGGGGGGAAAAVRFAGARGWEAAIAAADEADAREAQAAEDAAAAAAIAGAGAAPGPGAPPAAAQAAAAGGAAAAAPLAAAVRALNLGVGGPVPAPAPLGAQQQQQRRRQGQGVQQQRQQQRGRNQNQNQNQNQNRNQNHNRNPAAGAAAAAARPPAPAPAAAGAPAGMIAQAAQARHARQARQARQGQDQNQNQGENARARQDRALQRFLQMVAEDEEDGWNSDELGDEGEDGVWDIPER